MEVIPLRRPPKNQSWRYALQTLAVAILAFFSVSAFLFLKDPIADLVSEHFLSLRQPLPPRAPKTTQTPPPTPKVIQSVSVVDGSAVKSGGQTYRLVGFDTPEKGNLAHCEDERRRAEAATGRLQNLITTGSVNLQRVSCGCKPGEEGTPRCNYGRLCGSLTVNGRDVGQILIAEGLAHPYACSGPRCPPKRSWCGGR